MKIAVASSGKSLDSLVDARFGRCPYFLIIDSKTEKFEVIKNVSGQEFRGAGISAAQAIVNKGVKVAIAGNFGPNAVNVLSSSEVEIFGGVSSVTISEILEKYKRGKLKVNSGNFGTFPNRDFRSFKGRSEK